jgi:hypothetical protein
MKKILLGSLLGLLLLVGGLVVGYLGIVNMRDGGAPFILFGGILLFGIGMFVLYKAGRIDAFKSKIAEVPVSGKPTGQSILEKNSKIVNEWNETNNKRDKLKMLEAAGAAEEGQTLS